MAKKVAPRELIQQDFRNLKASERLLTTPRIEELVFMQSIEGRAHNGAGAFAKRFYVNTTIDDIVKALGMAPKAAKAKRQELIDEIVDFAESAIEDDPRDRLVTRSGRPFLGIPLFKDRVVNYHDVLKGLYLGGLRDDVTIRKKTQELFKIKIGYGRCYLVDTRVMEEMGLDGEMLAHHEHEGELSRYRSAGLIADDEDLKSADSRHMRYLYIRHHVGPGQSDDAAIVAAGILYNIDVALGVFLADAIDTLEKYSRYYRDQDGGLAKFIKKNYRYLDAGEKDVCELAYMAAIPFDRIDEIPDSSLRYLLTIDHQTGQSTLETHLNFIEGKPFLPIAISYKRISISELYGFINDRLKTIKRDAAAKVPVAFFEELGSSVAKVMQRRFITVAPNDTLATALKKAEARKSELIIVKDELGNVLGVINPADFLVFLKKRF